MKRKAISSLLALMVLVIASPSWGYACAMPCKMTQKQMSDCARSCSAQKPVSSIGHRACVSMQIQKAPVFTSVDAQVAHAPVFAMVAETQIHIVEIRQKKLSGSSPLRGPPSTYLLELPTANAPPQLI